jgi:hypothetical protein
LGGSGLAIWFFIRAINMAVGCSFHYYVGVLDNRKKEMNDNVAKVEERTREMQLDEMADFHARLSRCESADVLASRRITALEEGARGHYVDDPLKDLAPLIWILAALTIAPVVIDLVKQWRLSPSL